MLTTEDRQWFIDPIQSPDLSSDRLLVQKERWERSVSNVGKIIKVKSYEVDGKRVWWLTEEGNYVYGAPVTPKGLQQYMSIIGIEDDGTWYVGDTFTRAEDNIWSVRNVVRSDFMVLDAPGGATYTTVNARTIVKAAPWARATMPLANDSDAVVAAKVALAKRNWERRWADAEILREALERGWGDDIEELVEDQKMPKPVYGTVITGTALVPSATTPTLSDDELERIAAFREKGIVTSATAPSRVMVPLAVKFAIDTKSTESSAAESPSFHKMRETLTAELGDHSVVLGQFTANSYLTSVSA